VIPYDSSNPATLIAAMNQALRLHAVATALTGLPQALWQKDIPLYKAAHAVIIPVTAGPMKLSPTVPVNVGSGLPALYGKMVAEQLAQSSHGKGTALIVDVPDFSILAQFASSI